MTATDRIHDLLLVEGGWWTAAGISHRLNVPEPTVSRMLYRLRARKAVESKSTPLAFKSRGNGMGAMEWRREWRAR